MTTTLATTLVTPLITTAPRHQSLDALRGIAVMGILLMNIISFAMPGEAYVNPRAWGGWSAADLLAWAVMFVLVDGKMRGLFSLMFGASMLLVITRAESAGQRGTIVHRQRMLWLLVFGVIHAFGIWNGDILVTYALCGLIAVAFVHEQHRTLTLIGLALLLISYVLWGGVTAGALSDLPPTVDHAKIAADLKAYRGTYQDILAYRTIGEDASLPLEIFLSSMIETTGLFVLGMAMFRNGFMIGDWAPRRCARMAALCYVAGLPPMIGLAFWAWASGFNVTTLNIISYLITPPLRLVITLGHAAFALWLINRFGTSRVMPRIVAVGRTAFSNYLGTSILMTFLFYGYGFGLFGHVPRAQVYVIVLIMWAMMLAWSKPWLDRYHFGPLEWLWRTLARGERQAMLRR